MRKLWRRYWTIGDPLWYYVTCFQLLLVYIEFLFWMRMV